jgi:hypothetical protein
MALLTCFLPAAHQAWGTLSNPIKKRAYDAYGAPLLLILLRGSSSLLPSSRAAPAAAGFDSIPTQSATELLG